MKFLRTEYAALFGMILILLATVKHSFEVYLSVMYIETEPSLWQMAYVAIMLLAIDYAVLQFTIHGNDYAAQTFAFFIFLVNLFAFWQNKSWPGWGIELLSFGPGLLFSAMFAYGLFYFTDVFSGLLHNRNHLEELQSENEEKKQALQVLQNEHQGIQKELDKVSSEREELDLTVHTMRKTLEQNSIKAENFDLLLPYFLELDGYTSKTSQALKKGVDYWRQKAEEGDIDERGRIKMLAYETAYHLRERITDHI